MNDADVDELRDVLDAAYERTRIWVDPAGLGDPALSPIVVRYPDGSTLRGRQVLIWGPCAVLYLATGYPDGKHVAIETMADVDVA